MEIPPSEIIISCLWSTLVTNRKDESKLNQLTYNNATLKMFAKLKSIFKVVRRCQLMMSVPYPEHFKLIRLDLERNNRLGCF